MLKTQLKLPFVWYNSINKQHRYRPQNTGGEPFCLIAPGDGLLPFQINKGSAGSTDPITEFKLYDLDGNPQLDLITKASLIEVKHTATDEYLTYKGTALSLTIPEGCYYAKIVKGSDSYYSETFKVYNDVSGFVKLAWRNSCDIEPLLYQTGFGAVAYIDTYTEAIPPEINEEGENNAQGEFVPTLQRIVHRHKIELFAPDYLLDALTSMQVHDHVEITDYTDTVQMQRIKVTAEYSEAYTGTCKIEFELPGSYARTNCCSNMVLVDWANDWGDFKDGED